jgi:hypothetical protein
MCSIVTSSSVILLKLASYLPWLQLGVFTDSCGVCGKPSHNARTYQEAVEASDSAVSDVIVVSS